RFLGRPQVFYAETFGAGVSDIVQCLQVFSTISGHFYVIQTDQGETPVPYAAAVAACNHEDGTEAEQAWIGVSVAVGLGVASLLRAPVMFHPNVERIPCPCRSIHFGTTPPDRPERLRG